MADIIQLLPDSRATQIAAGEVIQRPASGVKELMENSIDAGATEIKLIVKDGGKTLVQVIDNGSGMTDTDLRMAFERHATSKIRKADDLFHIKTMGFRGEALASIAAIAHVEVSTRMEANELGSVIYIKGSKIERQEPTQSPRGTNFAVKNLFFNIPARRKFLKSDPVELRNIVEEFQRIALVHPEIFLSMYHNGNEVYHLPISNLRQRVVNVMGKSINEHLVPVHEETDILKVSGFVAKPSYAKKRKGEQYLYVNARYIKNSYLNHAIKSAFDGIIDHDQHPVYVLYLEIDPARIDINVHPTKTEIKFEDERLIYNYLRVSIKHALGQYQVTATIPFGSDVNFGHERKSDSSSRSPYDAQGHTLQREQSDLSRQNSKAWDNLYGNLYNDAEQSPPDPTMQQVFSFGNQNNISLHAQVEGNLYQLHNSYIITSNQEGMLMIDQQVAHERILYEQYLDAINRNKPAIQKELFPQTIHLDPKRTPILLELLSKINAMGFEVEHFGQDTFILHGTPSGLKAGMPGSDLVEQILQQYIDDVDIMSEVNERLAKSMARAAALKRGKLLTQAEMEALVDQLFACNVPMKGPRGNRCFVHWTMEDIRLKFQMA